MDLATTTPLHFAIRSVGGGRQLFGLRKDRHGAGKKWQWGLSASLDFS
jgi:hypothetical protein